MTHHHDIFHPTRRVTDHSAVGVYTMLKVPSFTYNICQRKKSLNDESRVNEHCDLTKNIASKYALLKLALQFSFAQETETNGKRVDHSAVDDCTMLKVSSFTYNIDTKA